MHVWTSFLGAPPSFHRCTHMHINTESLCFVACEVTIVSVRDTKLLHSILWASCYAAVVQCRDPLISLGFLMYRPKIYIRFEDYQPKGVSIVSTHCLACTKESWVTSIQPRLERFLPIRSVGPVETSCRGGWNSVFALTATTASIKAHTDIIGKRSAVYADLSDISRFIVDFCTSCGPIVDSLDKWKSVLGGDFKLMQILWDMEKKVLHKKYLHTLTRYCCVFSLCRVSAHF